MNFPAAAACQLKISSRRRRQAKKILKSRAADKLKKSKKFEPPPPIKSSAYTSSYYHSTRIFVDYYNSTRLFVFINIAKTMSELFEQIFNSIYQVLIEDGLVSQHGIDEEEKKKKSFYKCISILQSIQESLVNNEMNLQDNIKKILELLGIDAGDKKRLDKIFGLISQEISTLKGSVHAHQIQIQQQQEQILEQQKQIQKQQNQLNSIELKTLMDDTKLNSYEVARLFRFYYVDKMIKKTLSKVTALERLHR